MKCVKLQLQQNFSCFEWETTFNSTANVSLLRKLFGFFAIKLSRNLSLFFRTKTFFLVYNWRK